MTASDSSIRTSPAPQMPPDKLVPPTPAAAEPVRVRPKARAIVVVVLLACCAVAGGWAVLGSAGGASGQARLGPTVTVTRGSLVYSVIESGEVRAERRRIIANELPYAAIIKEVVPEGTAVEEGDTIIEFECKELTDDIEKGKITVTAAQNSLTQARENLTLKQKEMDAAIRTAKQAIVDANSDLKRYIEIEGQTKLDDANSDIAAAKQALLLAEEKLNFKLKVNADEELKSPFSENDIKAEKLSVFKLELADKKARNALVMLIKYDHPREIQKLRTAVEDAALAMARAELEARSEVLKAEALLAAEKATFDMQDRQLKELIEDAGKIVIKAEKEGLVVYDTGGSRWSSNDTRVEVGAKINPRQQLMIIPALTTLQIKTKVYEAIIDQVRPGLRAHVRLENKPDVTYPGRIIRVGVLPDSQNRWLNPGVKVFAVTVALDEDIEGLRPGMSSEVEIELANLDSVLQVPVATVYTRQDQTFCYRVDDSGNYERAPVKLGRMNNTQVEILAGLKQGDKVLLAPPRGEQIEAKRDEQEDENAKDAPPVPSGKGSPKAGRKGADASKSGAGKSQAKPSRPAPSEGRPSGSTGGSRGSRGGRRPPKK